MNETTILTRRNISTKVHAPTPEFGESTRTLTATTVADTSIKTPVRKRIRVSRRRIRKTLLTLGGKR
jgi:hypothetical protein